MQKTNSYWILIILLIIIILLIVPSVFMSGRGSWMHSGYGMMGRGMMGFGFLIPALLIILLIAGGVWLGNVLTTRGHHHPSRQKDFCANCSKPTEADWKSCPYCSKPLK